MDTFRIRTNNWANISISLFLIILMPYAILIYLYGIDGARVFVKTNIIIISVSGTIAYFLCNYLFSKITVVTVSEEGVTALWRTGILGFKKEHRTITWNDIKCSSWSNGVVIETNDNKKYSLSSNNSFLSSEFKRLSAAFDKHQ